MLRLSLFSFAMCLMIVMGSIYRTRQEPFEEFMLVQGGEVGAEYLGVLDPATGTQVTLTDTYYGISLNFESNDGWLYYWGKDEGVTYKNNEALYRLHVQKGIHQKILDDESSPFLTQVALFDGRVFYVRLSGKLASVNLDGTHNQDFPIPDDIKLSFVDSDYLTFSRDYDALIFAATSGENTDFYELELDGSSIHNLTENLPSPHFCDGRSDYEVILLYGCNGMYYYQRPTSTEFHSVLPPSASRNQSLIYGNIEKGFFYIVDIDSRKYYRVDFNQLTDPLPYAEEEAPFNIFLDEDWQLTVMETASGFELRHVRGDASELIFSGEYRPSIYFWRDGYFLLTYHNDITKETDMYSVAQDTLEVKLIYHTKNFVDGLNLYSRDKDFYFAELISKDPRAYQLRRLSPDGTLYKYHEWPHSNRLLKWTDIFVREWSPTKWITGAVTVIGLLFVSLFVKRWVIVR